MHVNTFGMHHLAKAVREINGTLKKSLLLAPRGHASTETTIESWADRRERLSAEQEEAHEQYRKLGADIEEARRRSEERSSGPDGP